MTYFKTQILKVCLSFFLKYRVDFMSFFFFKYRVDSNYHVRTKTDEVSTNVSFSTNNNKCNI